MADTQLTNLTSILQKYTELAKSYISSKLPKKVSELTNDAGYVTKNTDITGTAAKATSDASGNVITTTYATKTEVSKKADAATTLAGYKINDAYTKTQTNSQIDTKIKAVTDTKGKANGIAPLNASGKLSAQYIEGDIGQVKEGYFSGGKFYQEAAHTTEITGNTNTLYVDLTEGKDSDVYRYSGTVYVLMNDAVSNADRAVKDSDGNNINTTYAKQSVTYTKTEVDNKFSKVQSALTFDSTPTAKSNNPVTSDGIKSAIDTVNNKFSNYTLKSDFEAFSANCTETDLQAMWTD